MHGRELDGSDIPGDERRERPGQSAHTNLKEQDSVGDSDIVQTDVSSTGRLSDAGTIDSKMEYRRILVTKTTLLHRLDYRHRWMRT